MRGTRVSRLSCSWCMCTVYRISNPTMEEIDATNPEYQPMQVKWCPFVCPRSKNHPLAPIHPFSKQMVPSLCPESLTRHSMRSFSLVLCVRLIKDFLPSITLLSACCFSFFLSFFHFHCTLFVDLRELA